MCTHRRIVTNKYTGRHLIVDCGVCPACQQLKAIKRTNRIRNNVDAVKKTHIRLFVTLTYRNACIPYFKPSELRNTDSLIIYRDSSVHWNRGRRIVSSKTEILSELFFDSLPDKIPLKFLRQRKGSSWTSVPDKCGVIYNKDFQDFIKRLRISLKRHYNYEIPLQYFYVSEYGPTTFRPHFHALFDIPIGYYQIFKDAISQAWSFDDYYQCRRNIQIAKNAAAYVSSYVNRSASISLLFGKHKETRPSHHYSQGYGMGKDCFSIPQIIKCFSRRDLSVDVPRFKGTSLVVDRILFPKYVINRYFPKFTGYRRLTSDALRLIYQRPERIYDYAKVCGIDYKQCHSIKVAITHKHQLFKDFLSPYDYSVVASSIWTIYASNVMRDFYNNVESFNFVESYDNLRSLSYVKQPYLFEYLDTLYHHFGSIELYDYNEIPSIISKSERLHCFYDDYSKDKKIRNHIYSQIFNV